MATSTLGNAPNLRPLQQRKNKHKKLGKCQRCWLKKKLHNCPLSEGCSQSVFFLLSGLPITGPGYAIFVTVTAGGGGSALNDVQKGRKKTWHDAIRQ